MSKIKLDFESVKLIKELCEMGTLYDREIASMFGISRKHVNAIKNKKRWNYDYGKETETSQKEAISRILENKRAGLH
jgi:DNA invertase Pin-like site-specific DNA recombinase